LRFAAFNASPVADHFVDVTDCLGKDIASRAAHRISLENLAGDFDLVQFLRSNTERAGDEADVALAVTFEVINL
jgi:hypothetical protein